MEDLGSALRIARKERGYSQETLASLAGVSRDTIIGFEKTRGPDLGVAKLRRILSVLGYELIIRPANNQRPTLEELLKEADD